MWGPGLEWNCPLLHSSQSLPGSVEPRIIRFFIISLHSEHSNILSKTSFLNQNDYLWLQRQVHCKILFSSPPTYLLVNIHVVKFYAVLIISNHKQKDTLFRLAIVIKKKCYCLSWIPRWLTGKESACQCRSQEFNPWVRKISWSRK